MWDTIKFNNMCIYGNPTGIGERGKNRKNTWRNDALKLQKFGERHKFTDSICSTNSKQDIIKDIHMDIHYSQNMKDREILEGSKREASHDIHGLLYDIKSQFLFRNCGSQKAVTYLKYWKKKKTCQPRILHSIKLYFKNEGKMKTFR